VEDSSRVHYEHGRGPVPSRAGRACSEADSVTTTSRSEDVQRSAMSSDVLEHVVPPRADASVRERSTYGNGRGARGRREGNTIAAGPSRFSIPRDREAAGTRIRDTCVGLRRRWGGRITALGRGIAR
jgi:hypothetical protein